MLTTLIKTKNLLDIPVIIKFGQLEYSDGSVERGRTIFEELLANNPKRVDIWNIYLDMEEKTKEVKTIRHLYERATSLNLSSKKMKFFFKRWLNFEKKVGDDEAVEHVKQKAREYVEKS